MNKEEWLKAIKCTKEELIEWLNEMYENEMAYRDIIRKYENAYNIEKEAVQELINDPTKLIRKIEVYTKVKAQGFEYKRNWS